MSSNYNYNTNNNHGIGFFGLLTILFVALKLTNFIDWSWWLVLGPLYIPILIVLLFVAIIAIIETYTNR
jgi:hypothetical protein